MPRVVAVAVAGNEAQKLVPLFYSWSRLNEIGTIGYLHATIARNVMKVRIMYSHVGSSMF